LVAVQIFKQRDVLQRLGRFHLELKLSFADCQSCVHSFSGHAFAPPLLQFMGLFRRICLVHELINNRRVGAFGRVSEVIGFGGDFGTTFLRLGRRPFAVAVEGKEHDGPRNRGPQCKSDAAHDDHDQEHFRIPFAKLVHGRATVAHVNARITTRGARHVLHGG
jgi:hypothetical protein